MAKGLCKRCGLNPRVAGWAFCPLCLDITEGQDTVKSSLFVSLGLDTQGKLPQGRRLIYTEYADGSHPITDEGAFRLHTEAAEVRDGLVYAQVLDCEGYGKTHRILGTFPEPVSRESHPIPVEYAADGNLSSDFEETI